MKTIALLILLSLTVISCEETDDLEERDWGKPEIQACLIGPIYIFR